MPRKRAEGDEVQLGAGPTRRTYQRKPTLTISLELQAEIEEVAKKVTDEPRRVTNIVTREFEKGLLGHVGELYLAAMNEALKPAAAPEG